MKNLQQRKARRILCFGDSITYGEQDDEFIGWAGRLKSTLHRPANRNQPESSDDTTFFNTIVYNLGIASETTDGIAGRFSDEFSRRIIKGQDNRVLLFYGANDIVLHKDKNRVPVEYFIRNINGCLEVATNARATCYLLGLLPVPEFLDGQMNLYGQVRYNRDVLLYNQALSTLCGEKQQTYVDLYRDFSSRQTAWFASDGLHPNHQGHLAILRTVQQILNLN